MVSWLDIHHWSPTRRWGLGINKDTATGNEANGKRVRESGWYFLTFSKLANSSIHLADMSMEAVLMWVCVSSRPDKGWWWDLAFCREKARRPVRARVNTDTGCFLRHVPLSPWPWERRPSRLALGWALHGDPVRLPTFSQFEPPSHRGARPGAKQRERSTARRGRSEVEGWDQSVGHYGLYTRDVRTCFQQAEKMIRGTASFLFFGLYFTCSHLFKDLHIFEAR